MSPLHKELQGLYRNMAADEEWLDAHGQNFWRRGGICCPSCGVPGYSERLLRQERRLARIRQIKAKLQRDDRVCCWPRRETFDEFVDKLTRQIAKALQVPVRYLSGGRLWE